MIEHLQKKFLGWRPSFAQSKVFENALSLYLVQGLQYLIPLISFPWMVRALGSEGYGVFALSGACGAYVQAICDYGFSLSATKSVSQNRNDLPFLSRTVSSVCLTKFSLGAFALLACIPIFLSVPKFRNHFAALMLSCLSSFFASHFPSWLFQGMERMRPMAALSAFSKILQLILLIALIRTPADLLKSISIFCITNLAASVIAWFLAWRIFRLNAIFPSFQELRSVVIDGFEIFVSQIGVVIFANANTIALGIFASERIVGEYSIAEKIVRVGINLGAPIGTAIFPRVSEMIKNSKTAAFSFLKKCLFFGSLFFSAVSIGIFIFSGFAVQFISGTRSQFITHLLWILSPLPLSVFVDNIFGVQILLNLGFKKVFMAATLSAGLVSLVALVILVPRFSAYGAASAFLISELWILIFLGIHVYRKTDFFRSNSEARLRS